MAKKKKSTKRAEKSAPLENPTSPSQTTAEMSQAVPKRRTALWRRLVLMIAAPLLVIGGMELGLRTFGYGHSVGFFRTINDGQAYSTNPHFGDRFFSEAFQIRPVPTYVPKVKDPDAYRVFVFGGSAAYGDLDPAFGFARMLEVMLAEAFPEKRIQVVSAALPGANSHVMKPAVEDSLTLDGDLYVLYLGNNEVVGPFGPGSIVNPEADTAYDPSLTATRLGLWSQSLRLGQMIGSMAGGASSGSAATGDMDLARVNQLRVRIDDPRLEHAYERFEANLNDMLAAISGAGRRGLVCTVAANVKDFFPFASMNRADLDKDARKQWDEYYAQGRQLEGERDYAGAVTAYRQASAIDETHAALRFRLGRSLAMTGAVDEARGHLIQARDLDTQRYRADTRINQIIRQVVERRADSRIQQVDAAKALDALDSSGLGLSGQDWFYDHCHLTFEGNYQLAAVVFKQVARELAGDQAEQSETPIPPIALCAHRLARTAWDLARVGEMVHLRHKNFLFVNREGNTTEAAAALNRFPYTKDIITREGYTTSLAAYRESLEVRPNDLMLRRNHLELLLDVRQYETAVDEAEWLLKRISDVTEWRRMHAESLFGVGRREEGIAVLQAALEADPAYAEGHYRLGNMLRGEGKPGSAEASYRKALEILPRHLLCWNNLGTVLLQQGRTEEAVKAFERSIELDRGFVVARLNLGDLLLSRDDFAGAVPHFVEAARLRPNNAGARSSLGYALLRQGRVDEAILQFREALRIHPEHETAKRNLDAALEVKVKMVERGGDSN